MVTKEKIGNELYVWIFCPLKRKWDLLYKRWINKNYGMVMDRQPFTAKDVEQFRQTKLEENIKLQEQEAFQDELGVFIQDATNKKLKTL